DSGTGQIYAGAISAGTTPGTVFGIDPVTGKNRYVARGGLLSLVEEIIVYHAPAPTFTTTSVSSSANPSVSGPTVTFTPTVSSNGSTTPTGSVSFWDGTTYLGQSTVAGSGGGGTASFSTSSLMPGTHTITASYGGNGSLQGSSGTLLQTVTTSIASSTTS